MLPQFKINLQSEMKLKLKSIFLIVILLGIIIDSQAGTFKPFVRSRYSIRWRKTTPKMWDSTTATVIKEEIEKNSLNGASEKHTDISVQHNSLATIKPLFKSSTHSSDYDYYNNEVEEGEHKN